MPKIAKKKKKKLQMRFPALSAIVTRPTVHMMEGVILHIPSKTSWMPATIRDVGRECSYLPSALSSSRAETLVFSLAFRSKCLPIRFGYFDEIYDSFKKNMVLCHILFQVEETFDCSIYTHTHTYIYIYIYIHIYIYIYYF